uniref:F-box/kelch-repeat protein At3g06240-like n=1 Tax=Erigeron canadensis TaxID=72917 RepID=UPI001CB91DE9|nr:F-box/kelch-repeat protein At3g06240-like [Erigeron canadensis]
MDQNNASLKHNSLGVEGQLIHPALINDGFSVNPSRSPGIDLTTSFIKLPYPDFPSKCTVIGSVNGLICFSRRFSSWQNDYVIHIWNPSLSALMTLPPYTSRTPPPHFETWSQVDIFFRFGFDPKSDDHKLVLFTTCFNLHINRPYFPDYLQVEVYSTKKGSWNLITQKFSLDVEVLDHKDADCMDGYAGYLHWLCDVTPPIGVSLPWGLRYETIVAFDLSLETFSEIPLPDAMIDCYESKNITLGVLAGKLCVMALSLVNEALEVWVMDEL